MDAAFASEVAGHQPCEVELAGTTRCLEQVPASPVSDLDRDGRRRSKRSTPRIAHMKDAETRFIVAVITICLILHAFAARVLRPVELACESFSSIRLRGPGGEPALQLQLHLPGVYDAPKVREEFFKHKLSLALAAIRDSSVGAPFWGASLVRRYARWCPGEEEANILRRLVQAASTGDPDAPLDPERLEQVEEYVDDCLVGRGELPHFHLFRRSADHEFVLKADLRTKALYVTAVASAPEYSWERPQIRNLDVRIKCRNADGAWEEGPHFVPRKYSALHNIVQPNAWPQVAILFPPCNSDTIIDLSAVGPDSSGEPASMPNIDLCFRSPRNATASVFFRLLCSLVLAANLVRVLLRIFRSNLGLPFGCGCVLIINIAGLFPIADAVQMLGCHSTHSWPFRFFVLWLPRLGVTLRRIGFLVLFYQFQCNCVDTLAGSTRQGSEPGRERGVHISLPLFPIFCTVSIGVSGFLIRWAITWSIITVCLALDFWFCCRCASGVLVPPWGHCRLHFLAGWYLLIESAIHCELSKQYLQLIPGRGSRLALGVQGFVAYVFQHYWLWMLVCYIVGRLRGFAYSDAYGRWCFFWLHGGVDPLSSFPGIGLTWLSHLASIGYLVFFLEALLPTDSSIILYNQPPASIKNMRVMAHLTMLPYRVAHYGPGIVSDDMLSSSEVSKPFLEAEADLSADFANLQFLSHYVEDQADLQVSLCTWQKTPKAPPILCLCFRGSSSVSNWKLNFRLGRATQPHLTRRLRSLGISRGSSQEVEIHKGFSDGCSRLLQRTTMMQDLLDVINARGVRHVILVGHSLGGALATVFLVKWTFEWHTVAKGRLPTLTLFSVGAPRVGNQAFADLACVAVPYKRLIRLAVNDDPVPRSPRNPWCLGIKMCFRRYKHINVGIFLTEAGQMYVSPNKFEQAFVLRVSNRLMPLSLLARELGQFFHVTQHRCFTYIQCLGLVEQTATASEKVADFRREDFDADSGDDLVELF